MRRPFRLSLICTLLAGICILTTASNGLPHAFYISVCQMDHNPDTRSVEITFKIFTEDLEQTLEAQGTEKLRLGTERESENADQYIATYLDQQVRIEIDGRIIKQTYLGKEYEADVTWCYVELEDVPTINTITVTCTLLTDLFEDQTNMVHIKANGQKKSMLLSRGKVEDMLTF